MTAVSRLQRASAESHPVGNANFLVDLGLGDPEAAASGFAEVLLPAMRGGDDVSADLSSPRLILRRGVTGALDLYGWWLEARKAPDEAARIVTVTLLGPDHASVMRWRFIRARPVTLSYAPLRANDGNVLMETLEIAFDAMDVLKP